MSPRKLTTITYKRSENCSIKNIYSAIKGQEVSIRLNSTRFCVHTCGAHINHDTSVFFDASKLVFAVILVVDSCRHDAR